MGSDVYCKVLDVQVSFVVVFIGYFYFWNKCLKGEVKFVR